MGRGARTTSSAPPPRPVLPRRNGTRSISDAEWAPAMIALGTDDNPAPLLRLFFEEAPRCAAECQRDAARVVAGQLLNGAMLLDRVRFAPIFSSLGLTGTSSNMPGGDFTKQASQLQREGLTDHLLRQITDPDVDDPIYRHAERQEWRPLMRILRADADAYGTVACQRVAARLVAADAHASLRTLHALDGGAFTAMSERVDAEALHRVDLAELLSEDDWAAIIERSYHLRSDNAAAVIADVEWIACKRVQQAADQLRTEDEARRVRRMTARLGHRTTGRESAASPRDGA